LLLGLVQSGVGVGQFVLTSLKFGAPSVHLLGQNVVGAREGFQFGRQRRDTACRGCVLLVKTAFAVPGDLESCLYLSERHVTGRSRLACSLIPVRRDLQALPQRLNRFLGSYAPGPKFLDS